MPFRHLVVMPMQWEKDDYWINRLLFWTDLWPHRQNYIHHTLVSNILLALFYYRSRTIAANFANDIHNRVRIFITNISTYSSYECNHFCLYKNWILFLLNHSHRTYSFALYHSCVERVSLGLRISGKNVDCFHR